MASAPSPTSRAAASRSASRSRRPPPITTARSSRSGYNAANGEYGDVVAMGILDPTKVTRSALQNAASVAGLMITTEAMVAEEPKTDAPAMPGGGGMGGMGGMDMM